MEALLDEIRDCLETVSLYEELAGMALSDPATAMDRISKLPVARFPHLRDALLTYCGSQYTTRNAYFEKDMREEFFSNLHDFLPGAEKANVEILQPDQPDGFVILDGETLPVEFKLHSFDSKAKSQLLRYLKAYNTTRGIAVAQNLHCELPANILFVQVRVTPKGLVKISELLDQPLN